MQCQTPLITALRKQVQKEPFKLETSFIYIPNTIIVTDT